MTAIKLDLKNAEAYALLAEIYADLEYDQKAMKDFETATFLNPNDAVSFAYFTMLINIVH